MANWSPVAGVVLVALAVVPAGYVAAWVLNRWYGKRYL